MITVYVDELGSLLIRDEVATALDLSDGQSISRDMMQRVIADDIDRRKAAGQHALSDTAKLREYVKRINDDLGSK